MLLRKQHLVAENSPSPPDYTAHSNDLMYACCSCHGPATKFKTHKRLKKQNETKNFFSLHETKQHRNFCLHPGNRQQLWYKGSKSNEA